MKLYHYTSVSLAESICHSSLRYGHLNSIVHGIVQPVVWLTTDPLAEGHGLLTGNENPPPSQAAAMARVHGQKQPLNNKTANKMQIRIEVDVNKTDSKLIKFENWSRNNGEHRDFARWTGLSAIMNIAKLSDDRLRHVVSSPKFRTKEKTWYLYFGEIYPDSFSAISFKSGDGFVSYDFEKHGRAITEADGIVYASPETLKSLQELIPSMHRFDFPRAFTFVENPNDVPHVLIRCSNFLLRLDIAEPGEPKVHLGSVPVQIEDLRNWVRHHRDELQQGWDRAKEVYYEYFPHSVSPPVS